MNLRFLIVVYLISFGLSDALAQGDKVTYVPPSPNAASLLEYASVPVNLYTGTPEITVPLFELKGRSLSVPVSISYHASGNKVQDLSSSVGLGWTLNAGGVVTRIVRGLPDEGQNGYFTRAFDLSSSFAIEAGIEAGSIDTEPDIYFYNFNGKVGRFVLDPNKNIIQLPEKDLKIDKPIFGSSDPYWEITDVDGIKYIFGQTSNSRETTTSTLRYPNDPKTYISSWYLAEITLPYGNEKITFSYQTGSNVYFENYRQYEETVTATAINGCGGQTPPLWPNVYQGVSDIVTEITINSPKYISSINCYLINKVTLASSSLSSATFSYEGDRQDLPNALRLKQATLKSLANLEIAKYDFNNNSYFISDNCSTSDCKRLKLTSLIEITNGVQLTRKSFSYGATNLPSRKTVKYDHWGYYNNNPSSKAIPTSQIYGGNFYIGADKSPDEQKTQANILTQINDISGGYQKLFYQLNDYDLNGTITTSGGLRIYKIEDYDGTGINGVIIKNYKYRKFNNNTIDNTKSSGVLYRRNRYDFLKSDLQSCSNGTYSYGVLRRYSTSLIDFFDIGGTHIGYSEAQIEYSNNSKEYLFYTNFSDRPDDSAEFSSGVGDYASDFTIQEGPPFISMGDRSYERGLLKVHLFYDANGKKVKQIKNEYQFYLVSSLEAPGGKVMHLYTVNNQWNFRVGKYKHLHRGVRLLEATQKTYDQTDENRTVTNKITYTYNSIFSTLVKTATNHLNDASELKTEYKYPKDFHGQITTYGDIASDAIYEINKKYIIATPLETITWFKKPGGDFRVIGGTLVTYRRDLTTQITSPYESFRLKVGSPLTDFAPAYVNVSGSMRSFIKDPRYLLSHTNDSYDAYGHLIQETSLDGTVTQYQWGHNNSLVTAVTTSPSANPQVSSFTHLPSVGVTSITDPAGRNTYYSYDILNRLKLIKDHDQNIISRYRYHYQNTNEFVGNFSITGKYITNDPMTLSSPVGAESVGQTKLIWDFGDGHVTENGASTINHSYTTPGTYQVKLSKINPEYQTLFLTQQLNIYTPLTGEIGASQGSVDLCFFDTIVTFTAYTQGGCPGGSSYEWFIRPNGMGWSSFAVTSENSVEYQHCVAGTAEYKCVISDPCGNSYETQPITVTYEISSPNCPACPTN